MEAAGKPKWGGSASRPAARHATPRDATLREEEGEGSRQVGKVTVSVYTPSMPSRAPLRQSHSATGGSRSQHTLLPLCTQGGENMREPAGVGLSLAFLEGGREVVSTFACNKGISRFALPTKTHLLLFYVADPSVCAGQTNQKNF